MAKVFSTGDMAAAVPTAENTPGKVEAAGANPDGNEKPWETLLEGLQPNRTSFYIKMGSPYKGVYFTLDPEIVQFKKSDCLNILVTSNEQNIRKIDLGKLKQVFKKCPNIENLKFFGVEITSDLIKLITKNCRKLKNLELNLQETAEIIEKKFVLDFLDEVKRFLPNCNELDTLIIRRPSEKVENFICRKGFCADNVDRNWLFNSRESKYDSDSFLHHNHNFDSGDNGGCMNNFV